MNDLDRIHEIRYRLGSTFRSEKVPFPALEERREELIKLGADDITTRPTIAFETASKIGTRDAWWKAYALACEFYFG